MEISINNLHYPNIESTNAAKLKDLSSVDNIFSLLELDNNKTSNSVESDSYNTDNNMSEADNLEGDMNKSAIWNVRTNIKHDIEKMPPWKNLGLLQKHDWQQQHTSTFTYIQ